MSAIGRLWRRAPAWRLCLVTAIVCTGLAAMFPPGLPQLRWPGGLSRHPDNPLHAMFNPKTVPTPPRNGLLTLPPPDPGRQGIIAYAGRLLPLPTGNWQELAVARADGADLEQAMLLDRVEGGRLTGMILALAPSALSGAAGPVDLPTVCNDPARLAGYVTPVLPGQSPLTHEFWAITSLDMQKKNEQSRDDILPRGLQQLGALNVAVPDHMLAVVFVRSDETGWRETTIMTPDRHDLHRLTDWATRFAAVMHKGFDHTLSAADLKPSVARDPS